MLLKPLRIAHDDQPLRAFLLSIAVGFIILGGLAFILLAAGMGYSILFATFIYFTAIVGIITTYRSFLSAFTELYHTISQKGKLLRQLFSFCLLFFLLLTFVSTLAPTTAWDGLAYHYPLPSLWLKAHSFYSIPGIIYSNFPSSAELLFLYGFATSSDIAANHLSWFAGFLSVLYLVSFGKRFLTTEAGLAAGIVFLCYGVLYIEELQGGYIDLFQVFYIFAAFDLLTDWLSSKHQGALYLSACFSGFGLCIKHSAYLSLFFFAVTMVTSGLLRRTRFPALFLSVVSFVIIALLFPVGWYVKSYLYTGNPVYPFLYHAFGGPYSTAPDVLYWANPKVSIGIWQTIVYPISATFSVSMVQFPFRLLPPIILSVIPFMFLRFRRDTFSILALGYAIYFVIAISILEPGEPRYNLAAWALLGIVAIDAAFRFERKPRWFTRIVLPLFLIIPLAYGGIYVSSRFLNSRYAFIIGKQTVREYYIGTEKHRSLDCYPVLDWLNTNTSGNQGTILLAESRVFPLSDNVNYLIAYPFQTESIWDWDAVTVHDIPAKLREYGIKYIAIDYGPNYRGICEAWFIIHEQFETNAYDPRALHDPYSIAMANRHIMQIAGYSNPHLTYINAPGESDVLKYDGHFASIDELFEAKGCVDVKLAAAIMWLAQGGYIHRVFDDKAGAIFEVVE